eukprot:5455161-Prorocentrum_lima.AAC.1
MQVDEQSLAATFWPGIANNEWDMWIRSGHRKGISPRQNLGVYQCSCGYRYVLSECLGPVERQNCNNNDNPDVECRNQIGGQNH